jgi:hypothetical protein
MGVDGNYFDRLGRGKDDGVSSTNLVFLAGILKE